MNAITTEYGWTAGDPHTSAYINGAVIDAIRPRQPADILDAGCGNGALVGDLVAAGYVAHGIDGDAGGIAIAQASIKGARFARALFADDPAALGFTVDGRFDAVVSTEVVEHLYSPHELPEFAFKALRPNGLFVISTPYHGYLKNLVLAILGKWDHHLTANWHGGHIKFWSRATLSTLLEAAGFRVTGFRGVGRFPFLWKSMILIAEKPA